MAHLHPPIEPYDHGRLDTGDGNLVYWEVCGKPDGKPALVVHGGPGSGCSTHARRTFDPTRFRVVLFRLAGIPGVLIHGRLDLAAPLTTAWELARAWPGAQLIVVDDAGHTGSATMSDAVATALTHFGR